MLVNFRNHKLVLNKNSLNYIFFDIWERCFHTNKVINKKMINSNNYNNSSFMYETKNKILDNNNLVNNNIEVIKEKKILIKNLSLSIIYINIYYLIN